jgi:hypothetical protein
MLGAEIHMKKHFKKKQVPAKTEQTAELYNNLLLRHEKNVKRMNDVAWQLEKKRQPGGYIK